MLLFSLLCSGPPPTEQKREKKALPPLRAGGPRTKSSEPHGIGNVFDDVPSGLEELSGGGDLLLWHGGDGAHGAARDHADGDSFGKFSHDCALLL